ncbi:MAG: helix-turn-helix transcriptional regulator [Bacilli bacterium]|nr:helix-turn-helix transcriptional regulator [Bacilli bacterium]
MDWSGIVKRIRNTLLVTQVELAEELGVSFATVNRWEKGHHEPTIKQKRAIKGFCKKKRIKWEKD